MKLAEIFKNHLKELSEKGDTFGHIYLHLFSIQSDVQIELLLKGFFPISKGKNSVYGEYGIENWYLLFHKSLRQGDFFVKCHNKGKSDDDTSIGGHLDMILWNTIHLDKEDILQDIFKKVFIEMEKTHAK